MLAGFALFACGIAERHVDESDGASNDGAGNGGSHSAGRGGNGSRPVVIGGAPSMAGSAFATGGTGLVGSAGFGKGGSGPGYPVGGKSFGGMPPTALDCFDIPSVAPVMCEPSANAGGESSASGFAAGGDAGASSAWGASGGAGGAAGGVSPDWCVPDASWSDPGVVDRLLIDDLEDGDYTTPFFLQGGGAWFAVNDGSGQQFPLPCTLPSLLPAERNGSHYAMRTYGRGFLSGAGGYSLVGITVKSGLGCSQPLNAAAYTGVEFWVRGSGIVRFFVGTVETNPTTDFGTCSAGCYDSHGALFPVSDEWQLVHIPFSSLVQEGWGAPAFFDPAHLLTLEWSAKTSLFGGAPASCFDFWIDDVAFYR